MARSLLLTCLSSLYDAHPTLGSGIGRYRATTHLIRRRARLHRSSEMTAKFACSLVCLLLYMHKYARAEGGSTSCRRAARSMRHDHCCFSSGYYVHPRLVLLILIGVYEYITITHLIRIRALLLHRSLGTQAKFVSHEGFFFLARAPDGGVRVGT